jgi:integrase
MLRQIIRVSKFWREYAGELAVDAIDDKVMREFIPWRRDYYSKFSKLPKNAKRHPTDKTLQWDMMLGKAILRWAHEQGLRGDKPLPAVTFTPKKKRVRPAFELWEYRRLWRTLCKRIKAARDLHTRLSRELLRYYVLVLANSGIRPGEANNLRIRDAHQFRDEKGRTNYRLVVRGKTGERDVILRSVAAKRLDKFLAKRRLEDAQGFLFVMPDGSQVLSQIDQLNAALREAGIERSSFGEKYSMLSMHCGMEWVCLRSPATWALRFRSFRNIMASRLPQPFLQQGWAIRIRYCGEEYEKIATGKRSFVLRQSIRR